MNKDIRNYHDSLTSERKEICEYLATVINKHLSYTERKIWHGHPVWFIDGNPIVGYSSLKKGIRLMFWSGASFNESGLEPGAGKFKDASINFAEVKEVDAVVIEEWLKKAEQIQWDYKNIIKRKGELKRLK